MTDITKVTTPGAKTIIARCSAGIGKRMTCGDYSGDHGPEGNKLAFCWREPGRCGNQVIEATTINPN